MICVLSDTHDNSEATVQAVSQIKELSPKLVVHCGDITSPGMLAHFSGLPMRFVFGNCDWDEEGLKAGVKEHGFIEIGHSIQFTHKKKSFLVTHGDNSNLLQQAIRSKNFDYVFHGHTHKARDKYVGENTSRKPGSAPSRYGLHLCCT